MTSQREKILREALAITDEHGLDAVSMRTVAKRVGVSAMALYPHVPGKEALLDGLVGVMLAELLPAVEEIATEEWEPRLVTLAEGVRTLARRHPGAVTLLFSRPAVTPAAIRVTDVIYQAVLDAGVSPAEAPRVERMLSTFVLGFATSEVNGRFSAGTLTMRQRRAQLTPEELPAHHRLADELDRPVDWDAEFAADLADLREIVVSVARRSAGTRSR